MIIGVRGASGDDGEAIVVFGREDWTTPPDRTLTNHSDGFRVPAILGSGQLGTSVTGVRDLNADGFDDIVVASILRLRRMPSPMPGKSMCSLVARISQRPKDL